MADPAEEPELVSSTSGHASPFQEGKRRGREEVIEQVKRARFGGFLKEMHLENGTTTSNPQTPIESKTENFVLYNEDQGSSRITEANALSHSDKLSSFPMDCVPLKAEAALSNLHSPAKLDGIDDALESSRGFLLRHALENNANEMESAYLSVDINDPFYPYKKLGQVRSSSASECGSTTGPLEISASMRKWNEMKRNGFISTIQVKAPALRLRRCQPKKKKDKELKKMLNMIKQEQHSKQTSVSVAPSHLLSGLNPGIIKHVRNSKQVNSIIKAMLQNVMAEKHEQHRPISLSSNVGNVVIYGRKESASDDNALRLKLSSTVTIGTQQTSNHEDISSLSVKAATMALQWLNIIQHDIISRLAALQRSKIRVKSVIEMEFPCLFAGHMNPKKNTFTHSLTECSQKEAFNMHFVQWKAVFVQMEVSLTEEEGQLERWLRQVEELRLQCQEGLKFVNANGFFNLDAAKEWSRTSSESKEVHERELAVMAAAASLYSTCNMIMTT